MPTAFNEKTGELLVLGNDGQWSKPTVANNPQTGETLYHDGADWKTMPMNARDKYVGQTAAIANGAALGFGDEFLAGVGSVFDSKSGDYNTQLADIRKQESRYRAADPAGYYSRQIVAGSPLAIGTGGAAARGVAAVAPNLGRVAQAATVGAGFGGVAGFGSGEGGLDNRLQSAGYGAATGAALGATIEGVVNPAVSGFVRWVRGNPQMMDPQTLTLTIEGQRAAQQAGLDPAQASAALRQEFATQAQNALNPEHALATAEARTLPHPITLTRGQATLSPDQQMFESQAAKDVYGNLAGETMRGSQTAQQEGLRANLTAIQQRIGGGSVQEAGQGVAAARQAVLNAEQAARTNTRTLYDAARAANGTASILGHNVGEGLATIRQGLEDNGLTARTAGRVHELLNQAATDLRDTGRAVNGNPNVGVGNLFSIRQELSALSRSSDTVEATAAGQARRGIDGFLNDALDQDLIHGDPSVVELWRRAIAARRDQAVRFQGGDLIEKLVARDGNGLKLDPVGAMNLVFGQSNVGFVSKSGMLRGLERLRDELGPTSQAWNSLREEAFMRLARTADGAAHPDGRAFSGANFSKAWDAMQQKSPEVVRALFTNDERALISQFSRVARRVTTNVPGGNNSSNTSAGVAQAVKRMWASAFMGPRMAALFESVPLVRGASNIGNDLRATATVRGGFPTGLQPIAPSQTVTRSVPSVASIGGQSVNNRSRN